MALDIFCDVVVEILPYHAPMNKLHVLEIEKVYWKYILNMLIDNVMGHLGKILIKIKFHWTDCISNKKGGLTLMVNWGLERIKNKKN